MPQMSSTVDHATPFSACACPVGTAMANSTITATDTKPMFMPRPSEATASRPSASQVKRCSRVAGSDDAAASGTAASRRRATAKPPRTRKASEAISRLKHRLAKNRNAGSIASPARSATPLVIPPYTDDGEKAPACVPWISMMPISKGESANCAARRNATGASIATAAGPGAPTAVSSPASANTSQGITAARAPAARAAASTRRSMAPFALAKAKR